MLKGINDNDVWVNPNHIIKVECVHCKDKKDYYILYLSNNTTVAVEATYGLTNLLNGDYDA